MKPITLLIKYFVFCGFLGIVFGFNSYAFQGSTPVYLSPLVTIVVLWGFIYSHLKDTSGEYQNREFLVVYYGVSASVVISILFYSGVLGLNTTSVMVKLLGVSVVLLFNFFLIKGLFAISKNIIQSVPLDDDYDA